ncbi:MAG: AraC family transcriptional regulator [Myxococcota bacterium]
MDHVRAHIDGDLSLDALARVAGRSAYHFHRLFKAIAGETLTAFVQRARLERAAYLMMAAPERKLDSIALEVGFSAHSDLTRVFKKHYGVPPSAWDRRSRLDPLHVVDDYEAIVSQARTERPPPELRVVDQPGRTLFYVRIRAPFVGRPMEAGYDQLRKEMERMRLDWTRRTLLGWSWDNYETTPLDRVHCNLGFEVESSEIDILDTDKLGIEVFPSHRAVQARSQGPMLGIAIAWDVLYNEWLPRSPFETDNLPGTKLFVRRPDDTGWDTLDVWCSLAIRPVSP